MNTHIFTLLCILIVCSCNQPEITPIEFKSKEYDFSDNIQKILEESEESTYAATRFSFISEYDNVLKSMDKGRKPKSPISEQQWTSLNSQFTLKDASKFIVEKAKEHEIIMFNEAHHMPIHRNFPRLLLADLYKIGYRYLALETLGMLGDGVMFDVKLAERGFPMVHTGFYSKEPEYSLLIREALQLGFTIFGYDEGSQFGFSGGEREIRGAQNIIRQIEENGKLGKTIVLCGYDHLKEGESGSNWEFALAARLQEYSGNDPLTINQTSYMESLERILEDSLYQFITPETSQVLVDDNDQSINLSKSPHWYDYYVFHPRTTYKNGIPNWVLNDRKVKEFQMKEMEINCPCKVLLFDELDDVKIAAPIYVSEIKSIKDPFFLPLKSNKYKFVITNKESSFLVSY